MHEVSAKKFLEMSNFCKMNEADYLSYCSSSSKYKTSSSTQSQVACFTIILSEKIYANKPFNLSKIPPPPVSSFAIEPRSRLLSFGSLALPLILLITIGMIDEVKEEAIP